MHTRHIVKQLNIAFLEIIGKRREETNTAE